MIVDLLIVTSVALGMVQGQFIAKRCLAVLFTPWAATWATRTREKGGDPTVMLWAPRRSRARSAVDLLGRVVAVLARAVVAVARFTGAIGAAIRAVAGGLLGVLGGHGDAPSAWRIASGDPVDGRGRTTGKSVRILPAPFSPRSRPMAITTDGIRARVRTLALGERPSTEPARGITLRVWLTQQLIPPPAKP